MRMSACVEHSPQTLSFRSSGSTRSRSALELLLPQKTKLPKPHDGLLQENPTHAFMIYFDKKTQKNGSRSPRYACSNYLSLLFGIFLLLGYFGLEGICSEEWKFLITPGAKDRKFHIAV
jgi:hypothetical protein